jgi:hypothetical protein
MRIKISPLLLIITGALLLSCNLGILHLGTLKHIIWTWWPAVLIVAGILLLKNG